MAEMRDRLDAAVLVGVGAAFDFHAGIVAQAPAWMQRVGLEWSYRLVRAAAPLAALRALTTRASLRLRTPVRRPSRRAVMGPATVAGETQAAVRPSMAGSSLWAAVSQVATLGVQGIAALVILLLFGKGSDTDAVFAAYGLYGVVVLMCQTLRLTVVARLVEEPSPWAAFDRFLGAGLSMVAMAIAVELVFGATIARVLTGDLGQHAQDLVRSTLNVLCIGVVGQLVAALGAAVLAVRQEFRYSGLAYVAGGLTSVIVLVALHGSLDIRAAPVGVAVGSTLSAGLMVVRLWRDGYRPGLARLLAGARHPRTAVLLLIGSVGPLLGQLNFVISLAFAARLGPGMVTLYTGAFFAGAVIVAVTGSAVSLVLAAPIARTWDGRAAALLPHLRTIMRAGLIIIGPAVAVVALVGDDLVGLLLGDSLAPPTSISCSARSSCSADSTSACSACRCRCWPRSPSPGTAPWRGWPRWARPSILRPQRSPASWGPSRGSPQPRRSAV